MSRIISRLIQSPKSLFLVDGIGAIITFFFLFAILRPFNEYFGMPVDILLLLSAIAAIFCLYSLTCYFLVSNNWRPFLMAISIGNLLYCCLTMGLVIYYFQSLTALGVTYFIAEIILLFGLVFVEQKAIVRSYQGN